jgi:hypothetical protein
MDVLPPGQIEQLEFFAVWIVYASFLTKWGHLK